MSVGTGGGGNVRSKNHTKKGNDMKRAFRNIAGSALLLALLNLSIVPGRAASQPANAPKPTVSSVVATHQPNSGTPLSAQEVAKYQQKAATSRTAANDKSAGASGGKTALVVVGVAVVAGAIALAAGGGGGGGGGGY
jgi:hypothetical protein